MSVKISELSEKIEQYKQLEDSRMLSDESPDTNFTSLTDTMSTIAEEAQRVSQDTSEIQSEFEHTDLGIVDQEQDSNPNRRK